jgi:integrase
MPNKKALIRDRTRAFVLVKKCGQGQGRTADLPLFRRTLVPTELPDPERS